MAKLDFLEKNSGKNIRLKLIHSTHPIALANLLERKVCKIGDDRRRFGFFWLTVTTKKFKKLVQTQNKKELPSSKEYFRNDRNFQKTVKLLVTNKRCRYIFSVIYQFILDMPQLVFVTYIFFKNVVIHIVQLFYKLQLTFNIGSRELECKLFK